MSDFKAKNCTQSFVGWGPHRWILGAYFEGEGRDERGRGGHRAGREKRKGKDRVGGRGGEGAGSTPKLKLGPQNYFLGAGAVESAYWTSY